MDSSISSVSASATGFGGRGSIGNRSAVFFIPTSVGNSSVREQRVSGVLDNPQDAHQARDSDHSLNADPELCGV
jgi:hypothetical protein